jgi:chain length determinant protein tyrosine kinase EpsG
VLAYQQRKGRAFGEIALKLRLISRKQLQDALAIHFGHPYTSSESSGVSRDLVVVRDPFGPYAEELRTVAQRLMTSWWTRENNRLAITSPAAGEGRSHVAANLAVVLNQFGHRVLLIDADLRRSRQHEIFGLSLNPGLSRMLCGVAPQEVLRTAPFLPGLDIITAGPAAPNAADLLARDQFASLIKQAGEFYDVVLLDTPPGIGSVDAEIIAACAGSALTVAAEDLSRVRAVRELTKRLERRQVRIAGLLMNRPK